MISGWDSKYEEILKEFDFDRTEDHEAAVLLDSIISNPLPIKKIQDILSDKNVLVIGAGDSLPESIPEIKKFQNHPVIVADSALKTLLEHGITPDIVVTDLDGDKKSLKDTGKTGTIMVVHAHGDNISKLHMAEHFDNCIGTTQGKQTGGIIDVGGFTDGDRCVFLASACQAKKIILFGMDFDAVGRLSDTKESDIQTKLKKLHRARDLLAWLAAESRAEIYTASDPITGIKGINKEELGVIMDS